MNPYSPAPAVTTANGSIGSSTTIHPVENRVLSARECCHLQTIPNEFQWQSDPSDRPETHFVRRMIGEAVPPRFTELHGNSILGVLEEKVAIGSISLMNERCQRVLLKIGLQSEFDRAVRI
ncbi:MAG: DNA cytosine methyltransferase [Gammaproteobacteria bacterium]|nr:DNA cytosine methyltransferase [Gammaproteobacteria bacterium]